jgi:hypothetical protein
MLPLSGLLSLNGYWCSSNLTLGPTEAGRTLVPRQFNATVVDQYTFPTILTIEVENFRGFRGSDIDHENFTPRNILSVQ